MTEYFNVKGYIKWAHVYEPDKYAQAERWKLDFYFFNDEELNKFKESGAAIKIREDEDGKFVTFRRMTNKFFAGKGEVVIFAPPEISGAFDVYYTDQNGNQIRQYTKGKGVTEYKRVGEPKKIGNGSVAIVNFSTYKAGDLVGHRLEKIKVLDLVEFNPDPQEEPVVQKVVDDSKKSPKITTMDSRPVLSDELPF